MHPLFNLIGQPIKHRGQLNKGDKIYLRSTSTVSYKVVELEGDTAKIKNLYRPLNYTIRYRKGHGWFWRSI